MNRQPPTVSPLHHVNARCPARVERTPAVADAGRFDWLAPMALWPLARRQLPRPAVRRQGGGTQRADDEAMFAAIVFVLVSGVPWRALPKTFAVSWQNTHRRFTQWSEAGLWEHLRDASRAPLVTSRTRQWADTLAEFADERLNRAAAPVPSAPVAPAVRAPSAAVPAPSTAAAPTPVATTQPGDRLRPRIRLHGRGDFTARLFGPGHTSDQPARRLRLRRA